MNISEIETRGREMRNLTEQELDAAVGGSILGEAILVMGNVGSNLAVGTAAVMLLVAHWAVGLAGARPA